MLHKPMVRKIVTSELFEQGAHGEAGPGYAGSPDRRLGINPQDFCKPVLVYCRQESGQPGMA